MNQSNERNNFDGNIEENENNQGDYDFSEAAGTLNGAVAGAMIGSPFGLVGAVIGGVSGGAIGNQMVESAEGDRQSDSENRDVRKSIDSRNE